MLGVGSMGNHFPTLVLHKNAVFPRHSGSCTLTWGGFQCNDFVMSWLWLKIILTWESHHGKHFALAPTFWPESIRFPLTMSVASDGATFWCM